MAKILIKNQNIFAGDVPATGVVSQFGSLKAGIPNYSSDIDLIQNLDAWGEGWASAVIGSHFPAVQDMNSLFYVLTKQLAYLMQSGIPEWNSKTTYYIGSFVTVPDGTDSAVFISVADNNLNNALSNTAKWMLYDSRKIVTYSASNSYTVLYDDRYIFVTYSAGDSNLYLPEALPQNKGRKIFVSIDTAPSRPKLTVSALGDPNSLIDGASTYFVKLPIGLPLSCATFVSTGTEWNAIRQTATNLT